MNKNKTKQKTHEEHVKDNLKKYCFRFDFNSTYYPSFFDLGLQTDFALTFMQNELLQFISNHPYQCEDTIPTIKCAIGSIIPLGFLFLSRQKSWLELMEEGGIPKSKPAKYYCVSWARGSHSCSQLILHVQLKLQWIAVQT